MSILNTLKQSLSREKYIKGLGKIKTIIAWQIDYDRTIGVMNIYQSSFV